ncbi:MAG: ribosome maturation factor RimP [Clostridia bacterium]|nr:ribosome maturation factor RimP [Clostridia bacterium]
MAKNTVQIVREIISGTVEGMGYSVWDVEYVREAGSWVLRVTIDKPEGITIDDCEKVHRAIDPLLDEADPIDNPYYLQVSSPGIERVLRTDEHIAACVGEKVGIKLFSAINGSKSLTGILAGSDGENILVDLPDGRTPIPKDKISKIQTVYDF